MSSASSGDDGRKVAGILNAISRALNGVYGRKMASIMKAKLSASVGDDGCKMQDDGREMPKGRISSSVEETTDKGREISLKKGPWTQEEDAILIEYVGKYGEGNWNAIQKNSGLARCGKSCRFRWVNHLRPNLKKEAFTAEEEQRIVELHASMGNKWSKMAAELLGRTDNEIKNFWKTRNKRKRAGLTTYPEEVEIHRQQVPNGNEASLNPNAALKNEVGQYDNLSQSENWNIPDVEFRRLTVPSSLYDPSLYSPMPMMHPSKRLQGSDMIYNNSLDPSTVPRFDQYGTSDHRLLCQYADINGNIPGSSDPIYGDFKLELPSHQYFEDRKRIWKTHESSLPPLLEAADTPESSIQFQPNSIQFHPNESVPVTHLNNDGLLEPVLNGSKNLNCSNNVDTFQENNDHCVFNEVVQKSTLNPSETQWDEQEALRSSLGPHAASVIDHGVGLTQVPADSSRSVGGFVEPRSFA